MSLAYFIFSRQGVRYGIEAQAALEAVPLPEIAPAPEAPRFVAGWVNYRGSVLPVLDLLLRFEMSPPPYRIADALLVLEWEGRRFGLIADEVHQVVSISPAERIAPPAFQEREEGNRFVAQVAKTDAGIIALLDPSALLLLPEIPPASSGADANRIEPDPFAHLQPGERDLLRERAARIAREPASVASSPDGIPLAAFRLGEERFGASLSEIREFVAIGEITPIPCCPPHVLGCMNLRGEILPLFDIRGPLRVKAAAPWEPEQAIILSAKEISAGIAVDEVLSVVDLSPAQATDSPVIADAPLSPFLLGIARLEDGFLGIVNLPELLREGGLIVDEEV